MKIINFKTQKKNLLTNKQQELSQTAKICCISKESFDKKYVRDKTYCNIADHCYHTGEYRGATHSICNI